MDKNDNKKNKLKSLCKGDTILPNLHLFPSFPNK